MVINNTAHLRTNFTISIDSKTGIHTGISAFDRAKTIADAIKSNATFADFVAPGHIFPLKANTGGVLKRPGHTEGSVDLVSLAQLKPAAVICEVLHDNGQMLRATDLKAFAFKHSIKTLSIKALINYRLNHDSTILEKITETILPTKWGNLKLSAYQTHHDQNTHIALVHGDPIKHTPLVRIHSECLTGDAFGSLRCDCGDQLSLALEQITQAKAGVLLYLRQEGRGIGLANKLKAYALQDTGMDTVSANEYLGFKSDLRHYGLGIQFLRDLGIQKLKLLTNNPDKINAFDEHDDICVLEQIPLRTSPNKTNYHYLKTKQNKLGHSLNITQHEEHYE
jgi:3,4-dihydroxy 2-butanone 4-phosphate synthase/GTP cyclohydrolase II